MFSRIAEMVPLHSTIDQTGDCDPIRSDVTNPIQISATNVFNRDPIQQLTNCNFGSSQNPVDPPDQFMATGVTWWAKSAKTGQWYYLNTMTEMLPDLHIVDLDGDGVCDAAKEINPRKPMVLRERLHAWIQVGSVPVGPPQ
jgi:hypothetical protein